MNRSLMIKNTVKPVVDKLSILFDQKVFEKKRREKRFLRIDFSNDFVKSFNKFLMNWLKKFSVKALKRKAPAYIERGPKKLKYHETSKLGNYLNLTKDNFL